MQTFYIPPVFNTPIENDHIGNLKFCSIVMITYVMVGLPDV